MWLQLVFPNGISARVTRDKIYTDEAIIVSNAGKGTGVIHAETDSSSELKLEVSKTFGDFVAKFATDLSESLVPVGKMYPQYQDLLQPLTEISGLSLHQSSLQPQKIVDYEERVQKAMDDNEEFAKHVVDAFLNALTKNLALATDVTAFLAYVNSVMKENLLLFNALLVVKVGPVPKKLKMHLNVNDLLQHEYDPIDIPSITLSSSEECEIPVYRILKTRSR
jgi:hypothetical protein